MKLKTKFLNHLDPHAVIQTRNTIPEDYHCTCELCQPENFLGEIFNNDYNTYYSNRIRKGYYTDKPAEHLDVGQFVGYRWAIQNFCPEEGWVLDPTVGTGTAIVEAINNGRNAIGVELEYPHIAQRNIDAQDHLQEYRFRQGDALRIGMYLKEWGVPENSLDLIINGPPYPTGKTAYTSSDAPQRDFGNTFRVSGTGPETFNYLHPENIGLAKDGPEWEDLIRDYFSQAIPYLKPGGRLILLIKDLVRNKEVKNLHKETADIILNDNMDLVPEGWFIHRHVPTTMFMNTYPKRCPGVKIPFYQTGIILRKE